jgi:UDP-N-acetylmuramate dehydrogenase
MSNPFPDIAGDLARLMPELKGRLVANQPLADLTWLRVGGPAQVLYTPTGVEDLGYFLRHLPDAIPITVIGVGSNLIVRDGGVPGVVIRLTPKGFGRVEALDGARVVAGAAALDKKVADIAAEAGLGGLEFYSGIPGTIGGALRMNAGANGDETKDVVEIVEAVTRAGERVRYTAAEMRFVYRASGVPHDVIFTGAVFKGRPADQASIRARMEAVRVHRETVQPIREKTGGSTFKNPPGLSAWRVIDQAGLRGFRIGGAHMSQLHCNFLVNDRGATAEDVERLGETVRERVHAHSGVRLEWEVKRIGIPLPGRAITPAFGA